MKSAFVLSKKTTIITAQVHNNWIAVTWINWLYYYFYYTNTNLLQIHVVLKSKLWYFLCFVVVQLLNEDRNFMSWGLWITTIGCVCLAILFAVLSAVFGLINTGKK